MNIFTSSSVVKQLYFPDKSYNDLILQPKGQIFPHSKSHKNSKKFKQITIKKLFCDLPPVLQGITAEYFFDVALIQQASNQIQKNAIYLQAIISNLGILELKRPMFDLICHEPKEFLLSDEESSDLETDEENERVPNLERFYAISNFFYQKVQKLKSAIGNGQDDMIELLLDFGIIPDLSCLDAAIVKENDKLFNLFIKRYGLVPNQQTLVVALQTQSKNNKEELINTIIDLGVKPDIYSLNVVITLKWEEMIDKFLKFNIRPTQESMNLAIETGNINIVQKLLDLKMEPNEQCLEVAIEEFKLDESIIDLFLNLGVIPTATSIFALIKYNVKNQPKLVKKLIEHGARPDESCLVEAIQYQNSPMIEIILKYVKPDTQCLNASIRKNSISLYERFIQLGAIPDVSSLDQAVEHSNEMFVDLLLNFGVRPSISTISIAIDKDNQTIAKKLMEKREELVTAKR